MIFQAQKLTVLNEMKKFIYILTLGIVSLSLFSFAHAYVPDVGPIHCVAKQRYINGQYITVPCDDVPTRPGGGGGGGGGTHDTTWTPQPDELAVYMKGKFGPFAMLVELLAVGAIVATFFILVKILIAILTIIGNLFSPAPKLVKVALPPAEPPIIIQGPALEPAANPPPEPAPPPAAESPLSIVKPPKPAKKRRWWRSVYSGKTAKPPQISGRSRVQK